MLEAEKKMLQSIRNEKTIKRIMEEISLYENYK